MGLIENYHWLFENQSDPRCKDWFLMTSPFKPLAASLGYLIIVLVVAPSYMKNRPAFKLDSFTFFYNIFQVISCTLILQGILRNGWTTTYSLWCQPVDYSEDPASRRMLSMMWWNTMLKLTEFVETVVFVLRKKDNQVSFLHVYHHISTLWVCWIVTKFLGGGMASFPMIPNSFVHIFMYTYYLLSVNKNIRVQKTLKKIKPYLTIMQMVQFCIIIIYMSQIFLPSCKLPTHFAYMFLPNIFLIFYLFYSFFKKNFMQTGRTTSKSS